ncbi:type II secretion system F family protein [Paenibacillus sp. LPE1-1-1.1]|uniref:type II secretion system F family protein n=1 Tax=Paenibacillus sp. LPE1-1-1.1 TaxID=3135230 RepID=UPI0034333891
MNELSTAALAGLLFCFLYIAIFNLLLLWSREQQLVSKLAYRTNGSLRIRAAERFKRFVWLYRHLSDLLETLRLQITPASFACISALLLLAGIAGGGIFFQSIKGTLLFGALLGALPYTVLRTLLVHRRMQTQMDFLPAVELFYQCYLVTGERQVRVALQRTVEERRLLGPMQSVFEQLYRNLSVRGDDEASLRLLAASLGHLWADYFVHILRVALVEGVSVSDSLKELLTDMRKARRANEQERNRLLEIRVANFSPLLFLALFIGINLRYNKDNAYYYYVVDPMGRDMMLNAAVLIFASFLMGLWLSRKKM